MNYGKYKVTAKVVGKNLLGTKKVEAFLGRPYDNDIYVFQQHPGANAVSYIIPCLSNTTYSLSSLGDRNFMAEFNHYPINGEIVTNIYGRTITTSNTAKWLMVYINSLWTDDDLYAQLEYGDTATAYEPYKENNITFYINEPLRGVGDVKDRIFIKDDKVVVERNCGIRPYEDGDFGTYLTDKVNTVYPLTEPTYEDKVNTVYPLTEPTYEEVEYNDTKLFIESFKNSTLSYDSNVPVTSKLYYSYSVALVEAVQQTASISDEQDVMIIDLATQVAVMEMMLM